MVSYDESEQAPEHVEKALEEILERYVRANPSEFLGHLSSCPDLQVKRTVAYDSMYGCETGCDYLKVEGVAWCPHKPQQVEFEVGDLGNSFDILTL